MGVMDARRRLMMGQQSGYVKNGLVFHWVSDDSDGSSWTDRVGGLSFDLTNVSKQADGGLYFSGTSFGKIQSVQIEIPQTAELVFSAEKNDFIILHATPTVNNKTVTVASYPSNPWLRFDFISNGAYVYPYVTGGKYTASGKQPEGVYCNGQKLTTRSILGTFSKFYNGIELGARLNADGTLRDRAMKGALYQIRIYSRVLSDDEIFHNQELDMKRYGIA